MTATGAGWSLRGRLALLVAVVGLLLLGVAVAEAVVATRSRAHIDAVLNETGPLRAQSQELLAVLVDQETAIRGYALTGEREDLAPFDTGRQREQELAASMDRLLASYPELRDEFGTVQQRAEQWRQAVALPVIAAIETGGATAGQQLLTDQSRQQFDQIRVAVDVLQNGILEVRDEAAANVRSTSNLLVLLLVIAALVVLVTGVVLLTSLERMVIRPLTSLAGQVREVAVGDYGHRITGTGPPEFQRLGEDVDAMRQKIAADLAEVREARERIEWVNTQLQKQAEELTRSNRDLEQFAYVASHDLQEPLRKVASFCQLLQRRYAGRLDERADQYIAFAVDGAQRMQRLINDLLAFSRIGRLTTGFTDVDLNRLMAEVAAQTEPARQYADAELTWGELPVIRGEEPLLTNLLVNLVSNSVKFRRADVPPKVHVSARLIGEDWEITCQDNGIGIEPEFADKIFVIFQRLHAKDAYPGTGIGLAIVKKIVEYHGGRVWVDTDVPEGTAIRFTLPALPADTEAAQSATGADGSAADGEAADGSAPATVGTDAAAGRADDEVPVGDGTVGAEAGGDSQRPSAVAGLPQAGGGTGGMKEAVG
ncbi:sensor histidine kinase [Micromonospora sediminimaris]|uniref:histidine kinase n=1 Tax=Micromonospora sediminimaris TaxID=547162 RepID=A0A9W5URS1_9ACTN|nr:sensor histidine kinase [Micromonospora sediminimaris]GIJ32100.1 histidine kinase [Micromonospora sediminimaris]SFC67764.1 HAMP domain-containing protein [Micromonospora sediminimaris]